MKISVGTVEIYLLQRCKLAVDVSIHLSCLKYYRRDRIWADKGEAAYAAFINQRQLRLI